MKRKLETCFTMGELGYKMYWPNGVYPGFYKYLGSRLKMGKHGRFGHKNYYSTFKIKTSQATTKWAIEYEARHYKPMGLMDTMYQLTHRGKNWKT
jgi:hypothetical protein